MMMAPVTMKQGQRADYERKSNHSRLKKIIVNYVYTKKWQAGQ